MTLVIRTGSYPFAVGFYDASPTGFAGTGNCVTDKPGLRSYMFELSWSRVTCYDAQKQSHCLLQRMPDRLSALETTNGTTGTIQQCRDIRANCWGINLRDQGVSRDYSPVGPEIRTNRIVMVRCDPLQIHKRTDEISAESRALPLLKPEGKHGRMVPVGGAYNE